MPRPFEAHSFEFPLKRAISSEGDPRAEANQPRRTGDAGNLTEGRGGNTDIRVSGIRMVENVEDIRADLAANPLGELELLEDRAIEVPVARPIDRAVARQLSEGGIGDAIYSCQGCRRRRED